MKFLVIANPVSGKKKGHQILGEVSTLLRAEGMNIEVHETKYVGHPFDIVLNHSLESVHSIIVIGGDGTMHEVINGLLKRKKQQLIPLGLIPAGTGNSLMHDLELLSYRDAIQAIIKGNTLKIDIAKIDLNQDVIYSFNVIGWGLPAVINNKAEAWRLFGGQRYNIASLAEIVINPKWKVNIQLVDEEIEGEYSFFLACNTIFSGNGMRIAPLAKLNDHKLDLILLKRASRYRLIRLFIKLFKGTHLSDSIVKYHQIKSFSLSSVDSKLIMVDGQEFESDRIQVELIPELIEIYT